MKREEFTSRWGVLAAALGMAIGTGNIWRFPKVLASNGGGTFLIPWILFLLLWSIPLLIVESSFGRGSRKGTIGAFAAFAGKKFGWMGGFVGVCSTGILCYYSVITGWCLKYLLAALTGDLIGINHHAYWKQFFTASYAPLFFHFLAAGIGMLIISRGIVRGIEQVSRILIPALFLLLIIGMIRSLTLPGAGSGIQYMFTVHWSELAHYRIWLEALTQSAWSTGAGWGLLLTYGAYMRKRERMVENAGIIGIGNNVASLLAGLVIIPTIFALYDGDPVAMLQNPGGYLNNGLAFIWIPQLYALLPGGTWYIIIFFIALTVAALSSLIAIFELATRNLMDMGCTRKRGVWITFFVVLICGAPSALSAEFFSNQDWVWGIGLMVSGLLLALAALRFGIADFTRQHINITVEDIRVGVWFQHLIRFVIPALFVLMTGWWFYQSVTSFDHEGWWNPLRQYSLGTCLFQWGIVFLLLIIFNNEIVSKIFSPHEPPVLSGDEE